MLLLQSLTQLIMGDGEVRIHFDGLLTLLHGFVITVSDAQCICQVSADDEGERIQALRFLQFSDALAISSHHDQVPGVPVMSRRVAGIECERALVFLLGGCPAPIVEVQDEGQRGVGLAQVIVQGQRLGHGVGVGIRARHEEILRKRRIRTVYQPIFDLNTMELHGHEAGPPLLADFCVCTPTMNGTEAKARQYMGKFVESNFYHYELLGPHFSTVKGYDAYAQKRAPNWQGR